MSLKDTLAAIPPWNEKSKNEAFRLFYSETKNLSPEIPLPVVQYEPLENKNNSIYQELDKTRSEIRALDVHLSNTSDLIKCSLTTISLDDSPRYAALSYVWGEPTLTEEIILNGKSRKITKRLLLALRQFQEFGLQNCSQRSQKACRIWVDALCINQDNTFERNAQVQLMGRIYKTATIVLGWIGHEDEDVLGVSMLRGITSNLPKHNDGNLRRDETPKDLTWLTRMKSLCEVQYYDVPNDKVQRIKSRNELYLGYIEDTCIQPILGTGLDITGSCSSGPHFDHRSR